MLKLRSVYRNKKEKNTYLCITKVKTDGWVEASYHYSDGDIKDEGITNITNWEKVYPKVS